MHYVMKDIWDVGANLHILLNSVQDGDAFSVTD